MQQPLVPYRLAEPPTRSPWHPGDKRAYLKNLPNLPEVGASAMSALCSCEHLKRPGGSRRHVLIADTAAVMDASWPFSCQ